MASFLITILITLLHFLIQSPLTIKVNATITKTTNHLLPPPFPVILVLGDSTVDSGNNNYFPTFFRSNHLPYGQDFPNSNPTGRFSNGKLSTDMIAAELKIKNFVPPFLDPNLGPQDLITGVSFASGGCGFDNTTDSVVSIPVDTQLLHFDEYVIMLNGIVGVDKTKRILRDALVIISAGTNDFAVNFYDNPTKSFDSIVEYQDFLLSKTQNVVKSLYEKGCRKMIIVGLPPIGCLPFQMTLKLNNKECVHEQNYDAWIYNKKLVKKLSEMQKLFPGIKLSYADIYNSLLDMIQHPSKYGFEVTNAGCCGTGLVELGPLCNVLSPTCEDSTKYVFWDAIHPTEAVYTNVAQSIISQCITQFR